MVIMRTSHPLPLRAMRLGRSNAGNGLCPVLLSAAWLCAILALAAKPAFASLRTELDLPALCSEADIVAEGRISSVTRQGHPVISLPGAEVQGWSMVAVLDVGHVIKGATTSGTIRFTFALPAVESFGYTGASAGLFGIFFLAGKGQSFSVLNPYHLFVPAAPGPTPKAGGCLEQTLDGLANVFLVHGPSAPDRWTRLRAVMALETVDGPSATAALKLASADPDPMISVWAISALIRRDDLPALKLAAEIHIEGPVPGVENLTARLGSAISGVRDPKAVPLLLPLLNSTDVNIRRGAACALSVIRDNRGVRPLGQALYDPDHEVRYYAVEGLGEITGQNQWTPSIANFDQNEKKFLAHWRDWAKQLKPPITPKPEVNPPPEAEPDHPQ